MLTVMRRRITPATVIATLALVFAVTGGAYAANKYLITSTKQISPKVLKALKGANGKSGAAGVNGANGAQGPAGAKGENGAQGASGKDGVSVTGATASAAECPAGGVKYTSASASTAVCNGKSGATGFTKTLPSGATEMGAWSAAIPASTGSTFSSISFNIPLAQPLAASQVHAVGAGGNGSTCPGTSEKPQAQPGQLCVYEGTASNTVVEEIFPPNELSSRFGGHEGAGTTGAGLWVPAIELAEPAVVVGTWAVTAE